jgi:large subunit ribosomal protein L13
MMTGKKAEILKRYRERVKRKAPIKGPFYHRMPDRFVRRIIRGMLPYKKELGKRAYKNILCHIGVPENLQGKKNVIVPGAEISKVPNLKYIRIKEICKAMGAKI